MRFYHVIFMLIYFFISCKTRTDIDVPPTEIEIFVKDDEEKVLEGIPVYLFTSAEAFFKSAKTDIPEGYVNKDTLEKGRVYFSNLNYQNNYYVFISYRDSSRFLNIKNIKNGYKISRPISKSSIMSLSITVYPTNGIITYWTDGNNSNILPASVFLESLNIDSVTTAVDAEPISPLNNNAVTLNRDPGFYKWYAKAKDGCLWTGIVEVKAGVHHKIQLTPCNNGSISFYTSSENEDRLPITMVLNYTDTIGVITSALQAADCDTKNILKVNRPAGNYRYTAYSQQGTCLWTGSFSLSKGECKLQALQSCKSN